MDKCDARMKYFPWLDLSAYTQKSKTIIIYLHRRERRVYYLHRYKARRYPSKYLTIIDDAMDQKTTCIPRVRRKTKATCNLATVGTHLVGAIFHIWNGRDLNDSSRYGKM